MECREVRDGLLRGELPEGAGPHAGACDACRALLADHAAVGAALAATARVPATAGVPGAAAPDDALWRAVREGVARESGPVGWLRSRQTHHRVALVAIVAVLTAAVVLIVSGQDPIAGGVAPVIARLLYGGLALALVAGGLRSLGHGPTPTLRAPALIAAAALLPLAIAFLPTDARMHDGGIPHAAACFATGLILGIPALLVARLVDRGGRARSLGLILLAAGAGLAGVIALEMECAVRAPAHLLLGHATVVLAYLAAAIVARAVARRAG